jgi:hypothetical protein
MTQLTFADAAVNEDQFGPVQNEMDLVTRNWLRENPQIFPMYERFAEEIVRRGRRFSISLLTERIRWEAHMTWDLDDDGFKISNNHRAYLARYLIARHPDYAQFIICKTVKTDLD